MLANKTASQINYIVELCVLPICVFCNIATNSGSAVMIWSSVTGQFVKHIVQILLALDYSRLYAISSCCNKPYAI